MSFLSKILTLFGVKTIRNKVKHRILQGLGLGCETPEMLRKRGVVVGERVKNFGVIDNGHGYLVEIGDDVTISAARILTHDESTKIWLGKTKIGRVKIGNRVFIGAGSLILPNVEIGDDVIIGAGSIVNKDIPSNSVVAGNPAKVICSLSDYIQKNKDRLDHNPQLIWNTYWPYKSEDEMHDIHEKLIEGGLGFDY